MFADTEAFSSFSVDDLVRAKEFYSTTLGVRVSDVEGMGGAMVLRLAGDRDVLVYEKPDHAAASFTVLNFRVPDVTAAVHELGRRGVTFQRYEGFGQDEKGIARDDAGPAIAWFCDPAGNVVAVLEAT